MKAFKATVVLLIEANSEAEACDAISGLLTEHGVCAPGSALLDWCYLPNIRRDGDDWTADFPKPVEVSQDYADDLVGALVIESEV